MLFFGSRIIPRPAERCAALPQRLLEALGPLMGQSRPDVAARFLHTVGADGLVAIDQRLRSYSSGAYSKWTPDTLRSIVTCPMANEERQSLLFVACAHHDGRERQKAVWHLGEFPGFLTLAAALIRSVDWVPQVQFAARDVVVRMLGACAAEDVLAAWPIVLRLQYRERSIDGWLAESVEGWMLNSANEDLLRRARTTASQKVRAWAYQKSIERGETQILPQAVMQPDPRIGLHALRHLQTTLDAESMAALAVSGLDAPHPVVRRECLRALASANSVTAMAELPRMLLDRSAGVRRLAAYLARQSGTDARMVWRSALDRPSPNVPIGALASLAEEAEAEDAVRLCSLLLAERSTVRRHALKGLLRIGQPISPEEMGRLLQLGGNRVLMTLFAAVRDNAIALDTKLVLSILAGQQANDDTRTNLRRLLEACGLWDCLEQLLALQVRDVDRQWWLAMVNDWIGRSETYAPLGDMRKRALLEATAERAVDLEPERVSKIQAALLRH